MTAQDIASLISAWQQGAISGEVLFSNLQAGEIIPAGITYEEEQERIASGALKFSQGA